MLFLPLLPLLFSLHHGVRAGGVGSQNWGISSAARQSVGGQEKSACGGAGSFFTDYNGKALCCSDSTRTPPSGGIDCPIGWSKHRSASACIPPQEVCEADCGEGYGWNSQAKKCVPNTSSKCSPGQWFHDRSGQCCDKGWEKNPPEGPCDEGKTCPPGWFWHKFEKKCKPKTPRAPKPGCGDWDDKNQCCGGPKPPKPSPGHGGGHGCDWCDHNGGGGYGNGGRGGYGGKRDFLGRRQVQGSPAEFVLTDLDRIYCPNGLHACNVPSSSGEWAYECLDFVTELESCGGCASTGKGQDCTEIPNADAVGCEQGLCIVYSCFGNLVSNGTACVAS